jgi:nucleotide-binding universal stress UspA family protein/quercetin dioxygenase-like cupin family protein
MPGIHRILHPTDFSENSQYSFQTACALARDNHATLLVLHVMMPSSAPLLDDLPADPSQSAEAQQSQGRFPWPQPADPRISVEHHLAEGDPAEEILRLAAAMRCDVIVMGTHGRTGLGRLLTGSVAEGVLRQATCPVMVLKTPLGPTPPAERESTANPGDILDVRPLGGALASAHTRRLLRTPAVEVLRLFVRAGQSIPQHRNAGEILLQCLEGRVDVTALGKARTLEAGHLLQLPAGESHALRGIENASLLLMILSSRN